MCIDENCLNWWQSLSVLILIIYLSIGVIATTRIAVKAGPRYDKIEEPLWLHLWSCLLLTLALPTVSLRTFITNRRNLSMKGNQRRTS